MKLFARGKTTEEDIYRRLSFDPENNTLLDEIARARRAVEDAYTNFQNTCDPDRRGNGIASCCGKSGTG